MDKAADVGTGQILMCLIRQAVMVDDLFGAVI